ncbi:hypothetical protein GLOIN_2v1835524 [Rhizophagus clarus]|uniref:Uncharacterized protein n=1 Tax=Rhizophagus clarus TaxID=94130 RepID=A0A8H3KQU5_9GLOM|nr:hypothetical protein GLOIN_2v1835524 [Rhizophagus clarus]
MPNMGQLVKPIPNYLTSINNATEHYKRILNAFFTIPSIGKKSDAPPVDVFELITNNVSSNNLQAVYHHNRLKKFMIEEDGNREILAKFAMQVWNSVRIKENINDVENEIDK